MDKLKKSATPFLAGVITTFAFFTGSALGTAEISPSTQEIIAQAVEETAASVVMAMELEEQKRLDELPDPLDCNSFSWMQSCESINRQAKKNPTAPIRVYSREGVELNIPPGTSSAMIAHLVNNDEASTRAFIADVDRMMKHNQEAANLYKKTLWAQGGYKNFETSTDLAFETLQKPKETIDPSKVAISIFYDTNCAACRTTLDNLKLLKERYPNLRISGFQMNHDQKGLEEIKELYALPARELSQQEMEKLRNEGIVGTPTLWIDNRATKKRLARVGPVSLTVIENELERISLYKGTKG